MHIYIHKHKAASGVPQINLKSRSQNAQTWRQELPCATPNYASTLGLGVAPWHTANT